MTSAPSVRAGSLELLPVAGRRFGLDRRDPETGRVISAFGSELTGLAQSRAGIEVEHAKRRALKRRLAAMCGQVRKLADAVYCLGDEKQILIAQAIAESVRGRLGGGVGLRGCAWAAQAVLGTLLL